MSTEKDIDLKLNGTAIILIDEKKFSLRRPRMGEYRKLKEKLEEVSDSIAEKTATLREQAPTLSSETGAQLNLSHEDRLLQRNLNRELTRFVEEQYREWYLMVLETLCSTYTTDAVADDDLPVWFSTSDVCVALIRHWQSVPSLPGAN